LKGALLKQIESNKLKIARGLGSRKMMRWSKLASKEFIDILGKDKN
jgi:hypothetical protein